VLPERSAVPLVAPDVPVNRFVADAQQAHRLQIAGSLLRTVTVNPKLPTSDN
jgi:hypothetical protein